MASYALTMPFRPALDGNAVPIAGAIAVLTLTGSTTLAPVYTDSGLSVEATNPIVANSAGRFGRVYLDDSVTYRLRIFDAGADITSDTPLEDFDPYVPQEVGAEAEAPNWTFSAGAPGTGVVVTGTYPDQNIQIAVGASGATTGATWGSITGTLSSQTDLNSALALKAALASPTFTGTPAAPLAATGANTTQLATTSFVQQEIAAAKVQSIPIMASSMTPRTTNGAATGLTETTTNKVMRSTLDFDASTIEYAQFMFPMPKSWNEGTITAQFIWSAASGSGDVVWGIQAVALSDDDVMDAAFGTAQTVTDTLTAGGDMMQTAFTSAVTIAGTPAEGDVVVFQVYRNASSGSDTLGVDARLLAVRINLTTNAKDDS